jgi:hypothetical protein
MIVPIATRPQYQDHLAPIVALLPPVDGEDIALVASHHDLVKARRHFRRFILAQHGAGQSYGGDPRSERIADYPGGEDNGDVGLFLVPNEQAAQRWRDAYPAASVAVVGSPRLETLPAREPGPGPVVAVSFHWDAKFCPEGRSAFREYAPALDRLSQDVRLIGHGHPMRRDLVKFYRRIGVEYVPSFDDVCRRADVYVCDNSSTIFEFAASGRPVVLLNSQRFRRDVSHGLRFWDAADVGLQVNSPDELAAGIQNVLDCDSWGQDAREIVLSQVYPVRTAQAAADAITDWAT